MMRCFLFCYLLGIVLGCFQAQGASSPYQGYTTDVKGEKSQRFYEIYLLAPQKTNEMTLQELIFSPLTKEFKEKYRDKFGEIDTASINYRNSSQGGTTENPKTIQEENDKRKAFAEYMTKRLIEHHVDNYMKTQPQMKPVMEVKEKIQNVKVEVTKQVRLNIQYNFAGNSADFVLDNPYCDSKLTLEMNPSAFGPSTPQESRLWVSKNLNSNFKLNSNVATTDGIAYGDVTKSFPRHNIAATVGLSSYFKDGGTSPRETKYIVGFSQSF